MDIVGFLSHSKGNRYLFTIIDHSMQLPEAMHIIDVQMETVTKAFILLWVSRFGTPTTITIDN
ncbi:unnamed protein product [Protopolystoma xenopodis]|uniref:Integrase catalytic domain-containing protein n=1 Tax=Protopolystoma xenopodis TaxID=117903 RepID=A0A448WE09_9PLAT|nr:unnamed protein product [Protopolystoma xenopodis]